MKQITYQIRGMVTEAMIPAITASCESIRGVCHVRIDVTGEETATLALTLTEEATAWEAALTAVLTAKGLEISGEADFAESAEDEPALAEPVPEAVPSTPPVSPSPTAKHYVAAPAPKAGKTVSLTAALSTVILSVVLAVLLTFSLTTAYMKNESPNVVYPGQGEEEEGMFDKLEVIDRLFRSVTVTENLDDEAILDAVLRGYVAATGDRYAAYYTAEEIAEQNKKNNGESVGIGIRMTYNSIEVDGAAYEVGTIIFVYPDTPAEEAGVLPGDHIMFVGKDDHKTLVSDVGYEAAMDSLVGTEGTECAFTVYRRPVGADDTVPYEAVDITAIRRKMTVSSIMGSVHTEDPSVGIVRMLQFDNTTRDQFAATIEDLKAKGCTYFVLDLRYNPGGLVASVEDVLTFFLQEGDVMYYTKGATGKEEAAKVTVNANGVVTSGSGVMKREDVGKYRDLKFAVLVNEGSASSAEIFTSNIRDYELGKIVGETTYGKGVIQTTYSLTRYGYDGALKLTTYNYLPPCHESYDGVGITPDVIVELDDSVNIYLLPNGEDVQMEEAIKTMK